MPAGWKPVPLEMTPAQLDAWRASWNAGESIEQCYWAAVKAAPEPPPNQQTVRQRQRMLFMRDYRKKERGLIHAAKSAQSATTGDFA